MSDFDSSDVLDALIEAEAAEIAAEEAAAEALDDLFDPGSLGSDDLGTDAGFLDDGAGEDASSYDGLFDAGAAPADASDPTAGLFGLGDDGGDAVGLGDALAEDDAVASPTPTSPVDDVGLAGASAITNILADALQLLDPAAGLDPFHAFVQWVLSAASNFEVSPDDLSAEDLGNVLGEVSGTGGSTFLDSFSSDGGATFVDLSPTDLMSSSFGGIPGTTVYASLTTGLPEAPGPPVPIYGPPPLDDPAYQTSPSQGSPPEYPTNSDGGPARVYQLGEPPPPLPAPPVSPPPTDPSAPPAAAAPDAPLVPTPDQVPDLWSLVKPLFGLGPFPLLPQDPFGSSVGGSFLNQALNDTLRAPFQSELPDAAQAGVDLGKALTADLQAPDVPGAIFDTLDQRLNPLFPIVLDYKITSGEDQPDDERSKAGGRLIYNLFKTGVGIALGEGAGEFAGGATDAAEADAAAGGSGVKPPPGGGGTGGPGAGPLKNELFLSREPGMTPVQRSVEALDRFRAGTLEIPEGLTAQDLLKYRQQAMDVIARTSTMSPESAAYARAVQEPRIQLIDEILASGGP
jgi:hypothetical protein